MAQAMRAMQVTAMNGALAGSLINVETSVSLRSAKRVPKARRTAVSLRASVKEERDVVTGVAPAAITSVVLLADAGAANALTADHITGAFLKVQSVTSQATQTAGDAFGVAEGVFEQVFTTVKPAVYVATPYDQKSADYAIKSVVPFATDLEKQAEKALQSNGYDTKPVLDVAKTAATVAGEAAGQARKYIEGAQPTISSTVENVLSSDPLVIAAASGALLVLWFLAPLLLSSVSYALEYKKAASSLEPVALDLLSKEDYVLIDVKSEKEKSKSGVPSLPRNDKNKLLPIPVEEVSEKVRGQLRNIRKVEAEITALKIAALKRINKGSRLIIIDSNGDVAKIITRSLSGLGFNNTWVITDGFDGVRDWVQSKLGTEASNLSFAEIFSPSRIFPAGTTFLPAGRG